MSVCTTKSAVVYWPTAHTSVANTTATSLSELYCTPTFELNTTANWQRPPEVGLNEGDGVGDGLGDRCRFDAAVGTAPAGVATVPRNAAMVTDPANTLSTPTDRRRRKGGVSRMAAPYPPCSVTIPYVVVK